MSTVKTTILPLIALIYIYGSIVFMLIYIFKKHFSGKKGITTSQLFFFLYGLSLGILGGIGYMMSH